MTAGNVIGRSRGNRLWTVKCRANGTRPVAVEVVPAGPAARIKGVTGRLDEPQFGSSMLGVLKSRFAFILAVACSLLSCAQTGFSTTNDWSAGFFAHEFPLTLAPGHRFEAAGPFFYQESKGTQQQIAVPPFFSRTWDPDLDFEEYDFLYPVLTYDRFGSEYRWQIGQLFSFAGGQTQTDNDTKRFTLFPIYFQQRSKNPEDNYTAFLPFYGTLKKRLSRDETHFVALPLYVKTLKRGVTTSNYLYPIFHTRTGEGLTGWQVWPLFGTETKTLTWKTNNISEAVPVGGTERRFYMWPFYFDERTGLGTTNVYREQLFVPFYLFGSSPLRYSKSYGWPIGLTTVDDRVEGYHEIGAPWPIIVFRTGASNSITRVWPFINVNHMPGRERITYLGPAYIHLSYTAELVSWQRNRLLYFLYSDTTETNRVAGTVRRLTSLLPLFTARQEHDGSSRVQVLALLDPFFGSNKSIERNYAPIYSLWRSEKNPKAGTGSESILWNLYRQDTSREFRKYSLLFGLFQYQSTPRDKRWRLFYIPFGSGRSSPEKQPIHP